jgi:actin-like ATPase involved in cell morphogenesis
MSKDWTLAVDFGTCFTVAAAADSDRVEVLDLAGNGSLRIPSSVWLGDDEVAVGADAINRAVSDPTRFVRSPKRLVGRQEDCIIAGTSVPVHSLISAVFAQVWETALMLHRDYKPSAINLTCPAGWADSKRAVLRSAAEEAGMTGVSLVDEPVAAATRLCRRDLAEGEMVAVYDLGGGTFDAALLSRDLNVEQGFRLAGPPVGLDPLGGERFDQAIFEYLCSSSPQLLNHPDINDLLDPADERWRRARAETESQVRLAKEHLSRTQSTEIWIAGLEDRVQLNREELNDLIQTDIKKSLDKVDTMLTQRGVAASDLSALFLIGGSSRIPLVARLAWERLGIEPTTQDDPKTVVALGAALFGAQRGGGPSDAVFTEDLTSGKVETELRPTTSKGYRQGRHILSLENVGAVTATVSVSAIDETDRIDLHLEPAELTIDPHSGCEVQVVASARKTTTRGRTYPFECIVEVTGRSRQRVPASYTQRPVPLVPAVAAIAAMCLLIGLLVSGGIKSTASHTSLSSKQQVLGKDRGTSAEGASTGSGSHNPSDPQNPPTGANGTVAGVNGGGGLFSAGSSVGAGSSVASGHSGSGSGGVAAEPSQTGNGTENAPAATAVVTVIPANVSRSYGVPNPNFTATYSVDGGAGVTGIPGVSGSPSCSTSATTSSDAGTYQITCSQGTLSGSGYTFEYAPGVLTINAAAATLVTSTASFQQNGYANPVPVTFTATLTSSVTKQPLAGFAINFVNASTGTALCGGTTNASGVVTATCSVPASDPGNGFWGPPVGSFVASLSATTDYQATNSSAASF